MIKFLIKCILLIASIIYASCMFSTYIKMNKNIDKRVIYNNDTLKIVSYELFYKNYILDNGYVIKADAINDKSIDSIVQLTDNDRFIQKTQKIINEFK